MRIHGRDVEEERRNAQAEIQAANDAYFSGSLTYRVELHSLSGVGFQGGFDYWSIQVEGPRDKEMYRALDFIKAGNPSPISLNQEDKYQCKLVSLDNSGIKYVWRVKWLAYDNGWQISDGFE